MELENVPFHFIKGSIQTPTIMWPNPLRAMLYKNHLKTDQLKGFLYFNKVKVPM